MSIERSPGASIVTQSWPIFGRFGINTIKKISFLILKIRVGNYRHSGYSVGKSKVWLVKNDSKQSQFIYKGPDFAIALDISGLKWASKFVFKSRPIARAILYSTWWQEGK
jgi:hypothetical protein